MIDACPVTALAMNKSTNGGQSVVLAFPNMGFGDGGLCDLSDP